MIQNLQIDFHFVNRFSLEQGLPFAAGSWLSLYVIGTIINAAAILVCGIFALTTMKELSVARQNQLKVLIGVAAIVFGFYAMWQHINGRFLSVLLQIFIVIFSMSIGRLLGSRLGIQKQFNKLGLYAQDRYAEAVKNKSENFTTGFVTCTILFCTGPMAISGAIMDGMFGDIKLLILKSVMDGLAAIAFVRIFGWGAIVAAGPVLFFQGAIAASGALFVMQMDESVEFRAIPHIIGAANGLLITSIGLVVLEAKKIQLADYLPGLVIAGLLGWWWL